MYIKYSDKPYHEDNNLRKILICSGEILGDYDIEVDDGKKTIVVNKEDATKYKGSKRPVNILLDENVLEITEDMVEEPFDSKTIVLFDLSAKKIIKKTDDQLIIDMKEEMIRVMINKISEDKEKIIDGTAKQELDAFKIKVEACKTIKKLEYLGKDYGLIAE